MKIKKRYIIKDRVKAEAKDVASERGIPRGYEGHRRFTRQDIEHKTDVFRHFAISLFNI